MPIALSRLQAREAARACLHLAASERKRAEAIPEPSPVREAIMKSVVGLEELARVFAEHAGKR